MDALVCVGGRHSREETGLPWWVGGGGAEGRQEGTWMPWEVGGEQ